jgi:hypothetical protein
MIDLTNIPLPAPDAEAEEVMEYLRAIRPRMGEVQLTAEERRFLQYRTRTSDAVMQASINMIGKLENVSQAVGQPAEAAHQLPSDAVRWMAVEQELRAMLAGIAGANLVRRYRLTLLAAQATIIGSQLARDPANSILVPHLEEIKRLKSYERRKKKTAAETETTETAAE